MYDNGYEAWYTGDGLETVAETENVSDTEETAEDLERSRRRRQRIEEMKRQKRQREILYKRVIPVTAVVFLVAVLLTVVVIVCGKPGKESDIPQQEQTQTGVESMWENQEAIPKEPVDAGAPGGEVPASPEEPDSTPETTENPYSPPRVMVAVEDANTKGFPEGIISEYGVVIDVEAEKIIARKNPKVRISPASMTKILTVLTAAEALGIVGDDWETNPVLDEKFTMTIEITDYSFVNDCSNVGFDVGEEIPVRDLFYGTILPSGADCALGLACYVAGSQEAFVELMNQKLEEMGLSDTTHFTNCIGLYHEDHYSTVYDMAVILKAATDNPYCRNVLSAHTYNTASTEQHPDGIFISNWFLRRIEDKDTHGEVLCGKTGFVVQSKNCAASLAKDNSGKEYICVTAGSSSSWRCIYDHVELYQTWLE